MTLKIHYKNQNTNHPNFCSRNKIIQEADRIVRHVNNCYPRISTSLIEDFPSIKKERFFNLLNRLYQKLHSLREKSYINLQNVYYFNKTDILKNYPNIIKRLKCGNCRESAELTLLFAKMNGIENAQIRHLQTRRGKDLDHAVVYVSGKKPYIMDAWLGFADFVPNTIERYKKEISKHFDKRMLKSKKFIFANPNSPTSQWLNELAESKNIINNLKLNFPEWQIKK